jgi:5-methylcytosine-specific restriction endonuclease McrA
VQIETRAIDSLKATYYQRHRAEVLVARKARYAQNPALEIERVRRSRSKRTEYYLAWQREYNRTHRDSLRATEKCHAATPAGRAKISHHRSLRKARIRGATCGSDAQRVIVAIKSAARVACFWCGTVVGANDCHIDHIAPLSRGGGHTAGNIVPSCVACNLAKGAKLAYAEWQPPASNA